MKPSQHTSNTQLTCSLPPVGSLWEALPTAPDTVPLSSVRDYITYGIHHLCHLITIWYNTWCYLDGDVRLGSGLGLVPSGGWSLRNFHLVNWQAYWSQITIKQEYVNIYRYRYKHMHKYNNIYNGIHRGNGFNMLINLSSCSINK